MMNVELDIKTDELVQEITQSVVCALEPHLKGKDTTLFTVKSLAKYLEVSEQWIYERVQFNEIPFIKIGKNLRFQKHDILSWLDEHKTPVMKPFPLKAVKK